MVKILHLADLHLGKSVSGLSMIDSQRHFLNQTIELCKNEKIRHIIISGDVYDRSIPPEEAVNLLNNFLSKVILDEHFQVYMISGNHDSRERLACFNGILEKQGLFIDNKINKDLSMSKHVIKDEDLVINIYSMPYFYPGEIRLLSGDDEVKDFEKAVQKVIDNNPLNRQEINILNAHFFVTAGQEPIRSNSESKLTVGTIEQVSYHIFDEYDYVALGHLHCPQHIGRDNVRYAGSPLKYSIDEIPQEKYFNVITINSKDDIKVEKKEITPLYEFVKLVGTVDDLTLNSEIKDDRIVYFELTDESIVINASARLKIKYPHYVGLKYVNIKDSTNIDGVNLNKEEGFEKLTHEEQYNRYFHLVLEKDMDDIQKEIVKEIFDEIEKEDA